MNNQDIKAATQKSVRGSIGVVPQDIVLFNDTILHNVQYGNLEASMEEVEAAAASASILDFIMSLPDGWNTQVSGWLCCIYASHTDLFHAAVMLQCRSDYFS